MLGPWKLKGVFHGDTVLFLMNEIAVTRLSDEGKNNYMLYIDYVRSENG